MKNLKIYLSFFALLLIHFSGAQTELSNYLKIAAENNPGLKAKFFDYMAAMEKIPQATSLPDPQLAFGYFISTPETRVGPQRWNISLSQQFPWFGLLKKQGDVATNFAKAKYEEFENDKSNLFFEVKTTFYNCYFINKAIIVAKDNLKILQTFKNISLVKIETGKVTIADELRMEIEINDLQNEVLLMLDKKYTLEIKFYNLLNKEVDIQIPDSLLEEEMPFEKRILLDSVFSNNHTLKGIDFKMNAFVDQEKVAQKMGLPKFGVGVSYTSVDKGTSQMAMNSSDNGKDILMFPMISASVPLYRKKYSAMIKEAHYQKEAQKNTKSDVKNKLTTIYENISADYKDANRRIELNVKQTKLAKKALNVLLISYSNDTKNFDEVLRMEQQLLKYQIEKEKAVSDKNAAVAFVYYLLGH